MRIGFLSHAYEVTESTGSVIVQVVKNGSNDIAVSVLLNTTAGTALGNNTHGTVTKMNSTIDTVRRLSWPSLFSVGGDYTALSLEPNELLFSPAQSEQTRMVTILIINDDIREEMEQFTVQLSLPSGSTGVVLDQDTATVQIVDEDRECPGMECLVSTNPFLCLPFLSMQE